MENGFFLITFYSFGDDASMLGRVKLLIIHKQCMTGDGDDDDDEDHEVSRISLVLLQCVQVIIANCCVNFFGECFLAFIHFGFLCVAGFLVVAEEEVMVVVILFIVIMGLWRRLFKRKKVI